MRWSSPPIPLLATLAQMRVETRRSQPERLREYLVDGNETVPDSRAASRDLRRDHRRRALLPVLRARRSRGAHALGRRRSLVGAQPAGRVPQRDLGRRKILPVAGAPVHVVRTSIETLSNCSTSASRWDSRDATASSRTAPRNWRRSCGGCTNCCTRRAAVTHIRCPLPGAPPIARLRSRCAAGYRRGHGCLSSPVCSAGLSFLAVYLWSSNRGRRPDHSRHRRHPSAGGEIRAQGPRPRFHRAWRSHARRGTWTSGAITVRDEADRSVVEIRGDSLYELRLRDHQSGLFCRC